MKIKIINYPYRDYSIGSIVDLEDELSKSLISFGRAVFIEEPKIKSVIREVVETITNPQVKQNKKLLTNSLREKVQEAKKSTASVSPRKKRDDIDDI